MKYVSIVLLVLALGLTSAREVAEGYQVGDVAMDFRLKNIDEAMVSLKDYSDKKGALNSAPSMLLNPSFAYFHLMVQPMALVKLVSTFFPASTCTARKPNGTPALERTVGSKAPEEISAK